MPDIPMRGIPIPAAPHGIACHAGMPGGQPRGNAPPNGGGRAYMPIGAPGGKFMPGGGNGGSFVSPPRLRLDFLCFPSPLWLAALAEGSGMSSFSAAASPCASSSSAGSSHPRFFLPNAAASTSLELSADAAVSSAFSLLSTATANVLSESSFLSSLPSPADDFGAAAGCASTSPRAESTFFASAVFMSTFFASSSTRIGSVGGAEGGGCTTATLASAATCEALACGCKAIDIIVSNSPHNLSVAAAERPVFQVKCKGFSGSFAPSSATDEQPVAVRNSTNCSSKARAAPPLSPPSNSFKAIFKLSDIDHEAAMSSSPLSIGYAARKAAESSCLAKRTYPLNTPGRRFGPLLRRKCVISMAPKP
mmetsp:Transcript_50042/g.116916  ORF Transcript_50042/g.116916 Transcript_50042/m.116916 type:complete len:364 (-) Transcript_50042:289-1380(-)